MEKKVVIRPNANGSSKWSPGLLTYWGFHFCGVIILASDCHISLASLSSLCCGDYKVTQLLDIGSFQLPLVSFPYHVMSSITGYPSSWVKENAINGNGTGRKHTNGFSYNLIVIYKYYNVKYRWTFKI